jgi:glycosyltransferase involved in cell wall biosynthesis
MGDAGAESEHREADSAHRPLSIAGVDPERRFSGGETQVLGLTRELLRMGHRAELICDPGGVLYRRASAEGIRCHPVRLRNSVDLVGAMRLREVLENGGYDIVHFHTSRAHAMAPFVRGAARAMVVTRRMDYRPGRLLAPYLYGRAVDGVAAISRGVADALVDVGVDRNRIAIIPSGVDCDHFRPPNDAERASARDALGVSAGTLAIGTVGALEPRKGHRHLLEAVARINRDLRCVVAGDGSLAAELRRTADSLGIGGRVSFVGRVEDSRAVLWAMDIFVFPSLLEGLGVAAIEAAACGLATVASDAGGIAEVVGDAGILVRPADPEAIAQAVERIADDPEGRARMGRAARARAIEKFTMSAMAERTLALYRECMGARKGRR